jgi:hypothetical protein
MTATIISAAIVRTVMDSTKENPYRLQGVCNDLDLRRNLVIIAFLN